MSLSETWIYEYFDMREASNQLIKGEVWLPKEPINSETLKEYQIFVIDNPDIDVVQICKDSVDKEDVYIDCEFTMKYIDSISSQYVKDYIRFVANMRLAQLNIKPIYNDAGNNLFQLTQVLNKNILDSNATKYVKDLTTGAWTQVPPNPEDTTLNSNMEQSI